MRTTLDLNDSLLAQAKSLAAREQISFKALVERSLRQSLAMPQKRRGKRLPLPLFEGGKGCTIDLTANTATLDAMDADS